MWNYVKRPLERGIYRNRNGCMQVKYQAILMGKGRADKRITYNLHTKVTLRGSKS
jgi:hypothetical protein